MFRYSKQLDEVLDLIVERVPAFFRWEVMTLFGSAVEEEVIVLMHV